MVEKIIQSKVSFVDAYSDLRNVPLVFSIKCINRRREYSYDLSKLPFSNLSRAFSWSMLSNRSSVGHTSREVALSAITTFYQHLLSLGYQDLATIPSDIDSDCLRHYANCIRLDRSRNPRSYNSSARKFRALTALISKWSDRSWYPPNVQIPHSQFPGASRTARSSRSFTDAEFKQILDALKTQLAVAAKTIEMPYIPKYKGVIAPVEDVAPFDLSLPLQNQHNKWLSEKHRLWWWENNCQCRVLSLRDLSRIKGSAQFIRSLSLDKPHLPINSRERLFEFYFRYGAGENYRPRYLGMPSPIVYDNRWKKLDYLQWYWENYCNFEIFSYTEMRHRHPRFVNAIREHHGSLRDFFKYIGLKHELLLEDLIPYYIALLATTGLNPSSIQSLPLDCLIEDPVNKDQFSISWLKRRAFKEGKTIPSDRVNGISPVAIVKRIQSLTARFRRNSETQLFISTMALSGTTRGVHLTDTRFRKLVANWFKNQNIKLDNTSDDLSLSKRFRATLARKEYSRTGELEYVKTLLGHTRLEMTSEYVNRVGNDNLKVQRGIHLEALLIGISEDKNSAKKYLADKNQSMPSGRKMPRSITPSLIAHCKDPQSSPIPGQKEGRNCNAYNACLSCQNLVVTPEDIRRHYSFMSYHSHLLDRGKITLQDHRSITSERDFIFKTYIIPRYPSSLIEEAQKMAIENQDPCWKVS